MPEGGGHRRGGEATDPSGPGSSRGAITGTRRRRQKINSEIERQRRRAAASPVRVDTEGGGAIRCCSTFLASEKESLVARLAVSSDVVGQ